MEPTVLRQSLRIYVGERNLHNGLPLWEALVLFLRRKHIAGASAFTGTLAYGHTNMFPGSDEHLTRLSDDMPVMIEAVDYHARIAEVLPDIIEMMGNKGLVTVSDVTVVHQGKGH